MPWTRSATEPRAESITMGTSERSRTIRIRARPSSSGSMMSSTMRLGGAAATAASAEVPSWATATRIPSRSR